MLYQGLNCQEEKNYPRESDVASTKLTTFHYFHPFCSFEL